MTNHNQREDNAQTSLTEAYETLVRRGMPKHEYLTIVKPSSLWAHKMSEKFFPEVEVRALLTYHALKWAWNPDTVANYLQLTLYPIDRVLEAIVMYTQHLEPKEVNESERKE